MVYFQINFEKPDAETHEEMSIKNISEKAPEGD